MYEGNLVSYLTSARHRKCDEGRPHCSNCIKSNRQCEGYEIRLSFDVNGKKTSKNKKNVFRPQTFEGLAAESQPPETPSSSIDLIPPSTNQTFSLIDLRMKKSIQDENPHESNNKSTNLSETSSKLRVLPNKKDFGISAPEEILNSPRHFDDNKFKSSGNNLEQFSTKLFEDLESLLKSPKFEHSLMNTPQSIDSVINKVAGSISSNSVKSPERNELADMEPLDSMLTENLEIDTESYSTLDYEIMGFIDKTRIYQDNEIDHFDSKLMPQKARGLYSLSHQEENMMLKHFFKKLLPLLDGHPNSPWPDLALKYCDFDIARSCFISLACIHIYESRIGGNEYYSKGVAHINNTMDYLIQYITTNNNTNDDDANDKIESFDEVATKYDDSPKSGKFKKKQISSFVILVLINVHVLFAVLEKGKSSLSRFLFKVFASICQDGKFYQSLMENEKKRSLVVVLSWYDTVSAMVSPDCRLPYCNPEWYGSFDDNISTLKMMGCPGEIFKAMAKVCLLRHEIYKFEHGEKEAGINDGEFEPDAVFNKKVLFNNEFAIIKLELLCYRDYIPLKDGEEDYSLRLKGAQCWALANYVTLLRTVKPDNYGTTVQSVVEEFIDVYGSMDSSSPVVTQMVWPVLEIGCACKTRYERTKLTQYMDTLYRTAQMGTLFSLRRVVEQVWTMGKSQ